MSGVKRGSIERLIPTGATFEKESNMNQWSKLYQPMLILILAVGLTACAGKDKKDPTPDQVTGQLRQEILSTVSDPARAEDAAALAEQLRQLFVAAQSQVKDDMKTYDSMNADFNSTRAQFETFFDGVNTRAQARQDKVVAIHSKMQALLTAEEWKQLKHARKKALKTDLKLL
jgi:hypothetical protein